MTPTFKAFVFFDSAKVIKALDAATRRNLSKVGAFLRTRERSLIRKRKASAPAGSPPSSHAGDLRRLIFFGYDLATKTVVVGPAPFRKGEAPRLLEFGGTVTRRDRRGRSVRQTYRGNPFAKPALDAENAAGTIPEAWRNSVRSN
jgi:hypothetical protein